MPVKNWENNAAGNDQGSVPQWAPEGKTPIASVNDIIRENQAAVRVFYENPEWRDMGHTIEYVSPNEFRVTGGTGSGDISLYVIGQRVRMATNVDPEIYFYGTISAIDAGVSPPVVTVSEGNVPVGITEVSLGLNPTGVPIGAAAFVGGNFVQLDADNQYTADSEVQYFPSSDSDALFDSAGVSTSDISKYRYADTHSTASWRRYANYYHNGTDAVHHTNVGYPTEFLQYSSAYGMVRLQVADPGPAGTKVTWKSGIRVRSDDNPQIFVGGRWEYISYGGSVGTGAQEWKSRSRNMDQTYSNGTEQPIQVNIVVLSSANDDAIAYVGTGTPNVQVGRVDAAGAVSLRATISFIVPVGHRYQLSVNGGAPAVSSWSELTTEA